MFSRLHYYLRFLLGLTRWEMYGIATLGGLIVGFVFVKEVISKREAETLEVSGYDSAFLNKVILMMEMNKRTKIPKVNKQFGRYWVKTSNWKTMPETHENKVARWSRLSKPNLIDINTADSLTWISLKGIGPTFAHRILLFREKLGGFYTVSQLKEVYGLDSAWVNSHHAQLKLGRGVYRKFRINLLDWKSFRHPYIPYAQAKLVLNYRAQHGAFRDFEQLKAVTLLDIKSWERMIPYLDFD